MKNNKVLTLYYHRINTLENDRHQVCVSPENFRQQMQYLKDHYILARFEDDWSLLDSDGVVITFDDGYLDNLQFALPILEELQVPAAVFVSTGTMNQSQELWWDELEYLIFEGSDIPAYFQLKDDAFGYQWDTDTWEYRKNCYVSLHHLMKNFINVEKREVWLAQLWDWRGLKRRARKENLTVSAEECRELARSEMISIGAHTMNHPSLAVLSRAEQEREIKASVDILSDVLGEQITLFSYPFGRYRIDYNEDSIEICRQCGIVKAASTEHLLWNPSADSCKIPRKVVRDWDLYEFEKRIEKYWEEQ